MMWVAMVEWVMSNAGPGRDDRPDRNRRSFLSFSASVPGMSAIEFNEISGTIGSNAIKRAVSMQRHH